MEKQTIKINDLENYPLTYGEDSHVSHAFNVEQNYTLELSNSKNVSVGRFDFNGDKLKFEGDVEESAEIFIEFLLNSFNGHVNDLIEEEVKRRIGER